MCFQSIVSRTGIKLMLAAALFAALPCAPDAEARGGRRAGFFIGGLVVGSVLAPRHVYAAPYFYYPPPVYYAPYPATVTYVSPPPVLIQQAAPIPPAPAPTQTTSPSNPSTSSQAMSIEDRLGRLRRLCEQGLLTEAECHNRRDQILQEL